MPFVMRDAAGQVMALYREMAAGAEEYLPPSHAAVLAFLQQSTGEKASPGALPGVSGQERASMVQSDFDMIRVYEDLTDILLTKNIVMLTDFPPAAQDKLMRRKRLRSSLSPITELLEGVGEEEQQMF